MGSLQQTLENKPSEFNVRDSISNTRANLLKVIMNNRQTNEKKIAKLLVIGLSGAGKSTLMEFLQRGAVIEKEKTRKPTISFDRYLIDFGHMKMVFIDAPGQKAYWEQWNKYVSAADGIIFIFDSANFRKVQTVNKLIFDMLQLHHLDTPTLFLANKQDLNTAVSADSINNLLNLDTRVPQSEIFPISAINGDGVLEAFKWLLINILST